jgi:hypothetical protein
LGWLSKLLFLRARSPTYRSPISILLEIAVSTEQTAPPMPAPAAEAARVATATPWRVIIAELKRTQLAAWLMFWFQLATFLVVVAWPHEHEVSFSLRTGVLLVLVAAQLAVALKHVIAQFRCAAVPADHGRPAAKISAWAGLVFVMVSLVGGLVPYAAKVYLMATTCVLVLVAAFTWLVFLRTLARQMGDQPLEARIARFSWWMWIGAVCLFYRGFAAEVETVAGLLSAAIPICVVVGYARIASALAQTVLERAPR